MFNTYFFILLLLPLSLTTYYILNHFKKYGLASAIIVISSILFIASYDLKYLLILILSTTLNYIFFNIIKNSNIKSKKRKLVFSIIVNVILLLSLKYANLFFKGTKLIINDINYIASIGLFVLTLRQIAFLIDTYREKIKKVNIMDYIIYIFYFPMVFTGPMVYFNDIVPQLNNRKNRKIDYENLSEGLYIFAIGLAKKVLIANVLFNAVKWGYSNVEILSSLEAFLVATFFTFELYFELSSYCDMAQGISLMLNIRIPSNFNLPYQATSLLDFWNRWNITITNFLKEYLYLPVIKNQKGMLIKVIAIILISLIVGFNYGSRYTLIVWGLLNGIILSINILFEKKWNNVDIFVKRMVTFLLVNFLFIIFRSENINIAIVFFKRLFKLSSFGLSSELINIFNVIEFRFLTRKIWILRYLSTAINGLALWSTLITIFIILNAKKNQEVKYKPTVFTAIMTIVLLVWCIMSLY